ncbi:MAG: hypothetical protein ABR540_08485 [Acidimicrobiales bacterium]
MPLFVLDHHHGQSEFAAVFASWRGFESPLRHRVTVASCQLGGHGIWWRVEADGSPEALGYLPPYVAERTAAIEVCEVEIP